jgi:predicted nucleic acid-binding protein
LRGCEAIFLAVTGAGEPGRMYLVDTSVWVAAFRRPRGLDLRAFASETLIVTCLPVVQEVLQGFRDESAFRLARAAMLSFPIVESPLRVEVFEQAADLYRTARRAGVSPRSIVDCLIAACAIRNGLTVLHRDRDFEALARVSPLQARTAP